MFVCVLMLAYEALGYSQYDSIKKTDSNKIAEIMHGMKDWYECTGYPDQDRKALHSVCL